VFRLRSGLGWSCAKARDQMIRAETAHESEHWKNRDDVGQRCSQTTMDSVSTALESRTESEPIENLLGEGFTVIKGGMIVFLSAVLSQVLTLVTSMWITRALGPDQYGLYSLSLSVLVPIISLASLGLDQTIVRFMPVFVGRQENDRVKGVLYSSWEMASATSLMLAAMVAILAPLMADKVFHDSRMSFVLRALTLTIPFTVLTNIALSATRGLKVMHFDAGIRVARTLFRLVIWGVALYLLQNPLRAAVYGTVSAQAITAALTFGLVFWVFRAFLRSNIERMYKMLLKYALPLTLSVLMYSLIPRIDQLLLGTLVETRIVGIYSAAVGKKTILDSDSMGCVPNLCLGDRYNFDGKRYLCIARGKLLRGIIALHLASRESLSRIYDGTNRRVPSND
jgi:hypothetical protein